MSKRNSDGPSAARRERRIFTEEYKRDAVRLVHKRRSAGQSLAQVARASSTCLPPASTLGAHGRPASARADELLMARVRLAHEASDGTSGAPRIHRDLQEDGVRVGKKCVTRLMRAAGLVARAPTQRRVRRTDSSHDHAIAPNRLDRRFDVNGIDALDRVWVSDLGRQAALRGSAGMPATDLR